MNKAIFLDRDGVINKEIGYVSAIENFILTDEIIPFLKTMQAAGFIFIVVTNQSGIAKELYTHYDVEVVHSHLLKLMRENKIKIAEIYYCPHHSDVERCTCRKPDSGMLEKAIARFNINITKSYMIGDKERDTMAGEKAGVKSIHIESDAPLMGIAEKILNGMI